MTIAIVAFYYGLSGYFLPLLLTDFFLTEDYFSLDFEAVLRAFTLGDMMGLYFCMIALVFSLRSGDRALLEDLLLLVKFLLSMLLESGEMIL